MDPPAPEPGPNHEAAAPADEHGHAVRSKTPDLIRMANQIAANYAHHPAEQATGEVAGHLRSFWSPAMRLDLAEFARSDPRTNELHPLVVAALRSIQPTTD